MKIDGGMQLEMLTIRKPMPHQINYDMQDPLLLINELKRIVKDLKKNNPSLKNYKLVDVGFFPIGRRGKSHMSLYFKRS